MIPRVAVAPTSRPVLFEVLKAEGFGMRVVPSIGGVAWWVDVTQGDTIAFSQPNRLGLVEKPPAGVSALVEVDRRFGSLLQGGTRSRIFDGSGWFTGLFDQPHPDPEVMELAYRSEFLRRTLDALPGVAVVGDGPWLGAVGFLGGHPRFATAPPIPGLPGLGVVAVTAETSRRELHRIAGLVADLPATTGHDQTIPRRRLKPLDLCIP